MDDSYKTLLNQENVFHNPQYLTNSNAEVPKLESPTQFEENLNNVKDKLSDVLNDNDTINHFDNRTPSSLEKLDKNIEGVLFKINLLENKVKQM